MRILVTTFIAFISYASYAQQAPPQAPRTPPAPISEHETIVRLQALATDLNKRATEAMNNSLQCTGDLAAETDKLNQAITATQTAEAVIKALDKEADEEVDAEDAPVQEPPK